MFIASAPARNPTTNRMTTASRTCHLLLALLSIAVLQVVNSRDPNTYKDAEDAGGCCEVCRHSLKKRRRAIKSSHLLFFCRSVKFAISDYSQRSPEPACNVSAIRFD